ncbi:hypothetical protein [Kaistia terrae]|uniref:Uncharacterized protein n=1 Tax=Kaistia terrae TaxID=537017 RepID=A0ABW0PX79_9HYPH|nr:hypothetical protein [Kaistia terrae]MCX5580529.1 hypothetical protein [Kaistia terrae]
MSMTKLGHIPSPYGVPIAVYRDKGGGEDEFHHELDGCMTMAGIHGKHNRERCEKVLGEAMGRGGVPFQIFLDHGGQKVPHVAIPRPEQPAYTNMPKTHGIEEPLENWVTLALDHPSWDRRAAAFLPVLEHAMESTKSWQAPPEVAAAGLSMLLTAAIEHLAEAEIDCLEAAAFYAVSAHDDWRVAGIEWLKPVSATWFWDWQNARPTYRTFAAACRSFYGDLPEWVGGAHE